MMDMFVFLVHFFSIYSKINAKCVIQCVKRTKIHKFNHFILLNVVVVVYFRQIMANEGICLDALDTLNGSKNSSLARIVNCAETPRQLWSYDFKTQYIIHWKSNNCLTTSKDIENAFSLSNSDVSGNKESRYNVNTAPCMETNRQKWMLLPFAWK